MPARTSGIGQVVAKLSRTSLAFQTGRIITMQRCVSIVEADLKTVSLRAPRAPSKVIRSGKRELVLVGGGVGGLHSGTPRPGGKHIPGALRASIAAEVLPPVDGKVVGVVGTNIWWAPIHEYGGTIRPKTGRFLYIPVFIQSYGTAARREKSGKFPIVNRKRTGVIAVPFVRMPKREPFGQTQRRSEPLVVATCADFVHRFVRAANA